MPSCIVQAQKLYFVTSAVGSRAECKEGTNLWPTWIIWSVLLTEKNCTKDEATLLKLHLSTHNVPKLRAIYK